MKSLITLTALICTMSLFGQQPTHSNQKPKTHEFSVSFGSIIMPNEHRPFWLLSNTSERFGGLNASAVYTILKAQKRVSDGQKLDYFYGTEYVTGASTHLSRRLIQAYAGISYSGFLLTAGKREENFGFVPAELGFGNLVNGTNASPVPKISIQTKDWIPLLSGSLSVKGYLAHGWLESSRYQSRALLHQKYLYLRLRPPKTPISFIFGMTHNAQWGGENLQNQVKQPLGLRNFSRIFLASMGRDNASQSDQINALGNHLGTWDLKADIALGDWSLENYIQRIWEDGSGLKPKNWFSGIYGISVARKKGSGILNRLNVEIVRTDEQGGNLNPLHPLGNFDNFLNNSVYRSGWTYKNVVIGSPIFLLLDPDNSSNGRIGNIINGVSLFAQGAFRNFDYGISFRRFKNAGIKTDLVEPRHVVRSLMAQGKWTFDKHSFLFQTEYNWGNYVGRGVGFRLEFQRNLTW